MADPQRTAEDFAALAEIADLAELADLAQSDALRRARLLPPGLRAYALGEALPWLNGQDRRHAAAWLILRARRGDGPAGVGAVLSRLGRLLFGGEDLPAGHQALFQLARCWNAVPEPMREPALHAAGANRWLRAIDHALGLPEPQARAGAVELAGLIASRLNALSALERVVPLLADEDRAVALAAERALVRATGRAAELGLDADGDPTSDRSAAAGQAGAQADAQEPPIEPVTVRGVEAVIAQAVARFDTHRRFGVLLAALALLHDAAVSAGRRGFGSPLARWLVERPGPRTKNAHAALRTVLRKAELPLARRRALSWIVIDHLSQAATDRLSRATTLAEHEVVLASAFLTRRRLRASRVAGMQALPSMPSAPGTHPLGADRAAQAQPATGARPRPALAAIDWPEACPVPGEGMIDRLSPQARASLAEWMAAAGVDRPIRLRVLAGLLTDDHPPVRLSLVRHGPSTLAEDLAYDPSEAIARSAALRLSRLGEPLEAYPAATQPLETWQRHLDRHPHAVLRMIGRQELARSGRLGSGPLAACSVRMALRLGGHDQAQWLVQAIEQGPAQRRIEAITLCRRLGLPASHQAIRDALLAVVMLAGPAGGLAEDDPLQRVAATAVRALSQAPGREVGRALESACRYPAARVRANAVEALEDRRRRGLTDLPADRFVELAVALTGDAHQRVRANAVRAGLLGLEAKPTDAVRSACASALRSMLGDERSAHRLSGLWVAGRVLRRGPELSLGARWTELAAVIADMARHDTDARARDRAQACLGCLEAEARQRWRRGAGDERRRHAKGSPASNNSSAPQAPSPGDPQQQEALA
ncbi:MAG: hypothetical protein KatS3mg103_0713 [Phycisphaerales bacterium]|nr:MAG: hypothetical protein KatS3mg103_0713 [Phycisphaerales bacterium]